MAEIEYDLPQAYAKGPDVLLTTTKTVPLLEAPDNNIPVQMDRSPFWRDVLPLFEPLGNGAVRMTLRCGQFGFAEGRDLRPPYYTFPVERIVFAPSLRLPRGWSMTLVTGGDVPPNHITDYDKSIYGYGLNKYIRWVIGRA